MLRKCNKGCSGSVSKDCFVAVENYRFSFPRNCFRLNERYVFVAPAPCSFSEGYETFAFYKYFVQCHKNSLNDKNQRIKF